MDTNETWLHQRTARIAWTKFIRPFKRNMAQGHLNRKFQRVHESGKKNIVPSLQVSGETKKMKYSCHILGEPDQSALWVMIYFLPYNPFFADETLPGYRYSVTIFMFRRATFLSSRLWKTVIVCHIWPRGFAIYLQILYEIQRSVYKVIGPDLIEFNHFPTTVTRVHCKFSINIYTAIILMCFYPWLID